MEDLLIIGIGVLAVIFLFIYFRKKAKSHNCAKCQFNQEL